MLKATIKVIVVAHPLLKMKEFAPIGGETRVHPVTQCHNKANT